MPDKKGTIAVYATEALKEKINVIATAIGASISSWSKLRLEEAVKKEEAK